jgi:hypothetical protein
MEDTGRWFYTLRGLGPVRVEERVPFRAQLHLLPLDGRRPAWWARCEDLSERGLFASSRELLPIDSYVVVRLRTSAGELRLTGRVVHQIEGVGFGCEFVDMDLRQQEAVAFLVALSRYHAQAAVG